MEEIVERIIKIAIEKRDFGYLLSDFCKTQFVIKNLCDQAMERLDDFRDRVRLNGSRIRDPRQIEDEDERISIEYEDIGLVVQDLCPSDDEYQFYETMRNTCARSDIDALLDFIYNQHKRSRKE